MAIRQSAKILTADSITLHKRDPIFVNQVQPLASAGKRKGREMDKPALIGWVKLSNT
jgi:hypothetical protein